MYAATPRISHSGSSLKPEPMSLFPRLVSGWYWWYAEPSANWVDAMSMMPLAGPLRDQVHEAEQVLVGVAEAHPAADPGLEERGERRHVERDHALVRVPDVDHPVQLLVAGLHARTCPAARSSARAAPRARRRPARWCRTAAEQLVRALGLLTTAGRSAHLSSSSGSRRSRARRRRTAGLAGREGDLQAGASRSGASRWRTEFGGLAAGHGTCGLAEAVVQAPRNVSRSVSKPATSAFTP